MNLDSINRTFYQLDDDHAAKKKGRKDLQIVFARSQLPVVGHGGLSVS